MDEAERFGRLEERMNVVEEGVSNFRNFQVDARDFFSRADERARTEIEFRNKRDREIKDALAGANRRLNTHIAIASLIIGTMLLILSILALPELNRVLHGDLSVKDSGQHLAGSQFDAGNPSSVSYNLSH